MKIIVLLIFTLHLNAAEQIKVQINQGRGTHVKTLNLEDYVAGVISGEMPQSWPLEALKAQALSARTYALYQKYHSKNPDYHVKSNIFDQVYKSKNITERARQAVKQTHGQVITYASPNPQIIKTYFHSSCGDHTGSAKGVWGENLDYLPGSKCGFCDLKKNKYYNWTYKISKSKLRKLIGSESFEIYKRDKYGRALKVKLNNSKIISANKFRSLLGYSNLKSTNITKIKKNRRDIIFYGKGFGHGVGMCQYGAYGMAKNGKSAQDIIARYYPGTQIMKMY